MIGLDAEDAEQADRLLREADREACSAFEWAVVRLLSLIISALRRHDS